jgi:hypothetical protein
MPYLDGLKRQHSLPYIPTSTAENSSVVAPPDLCKADQRGIKHKIVTFEGKYRCCMEALSMFKGTFSIYASPKKAGNNLETFYSLSSNLYLFCTYKSVKC